MSNHIVFMAGQEDSECLFRVREDYSPVFELANAVWKKNFGEDLFVVENEEELTNECYDRAYGGFLG